MRFFSKNQEVQKCEIRSLEEMNWHKSNIFQVLKSKISQTLENKEILDMIELMMYEKNPAKQYRNMIPESEERLLQHCYFNWFWMD